MRATSACTPRIVGSVCSPRRISTVASTTSLSAACPATPRRGRLPTSTVATSDSSTGTPPSVESTTLRTSSRSRIRPIPCTTAACGPMRTVSASRHRRAGIRPATALRVSWARRRRTASGRPATMCKRRHRRRAGRRPPSRSKGADGGDRCRGRFRVRLGTHRQLEARQGARSASAAFRFKRWAPPADPGRAPPAAASRSSLDPHSQVPPSPDPPAAVRPGAPHGNEGPRDKARAADIAFSELTST